jgi:hypothetical protein
MTRRKRPNNFIHAHSQPRRMPALPAGIANTSSPFEDVSDCIDPEQVPAKRGPYRNWAAA